MDDRVGGDRWNRAYTYRCRVPPARRSATLGVRVCNTPLITLGYLLCGSGFDPLTIGIGFALALIAVEGGALLLLRRRRLAIGSGPAG